MCFIYFFPLKEQAKEPVNAELYQQYLRSEYNDKIQELKNQISFLNEQIQDSTIDLKIERDEHNKKMEKDAIILSLQEEIESLKELNPQALDKSQFSLKISILKFYLNYYYLIRS